MRRDRRGDECTTLDVGESDASCIHHWCVATGGVNPLRYFPLKKMVFMVLRGANDIFKNIDDANILLLLFDELLFFEWRSAAGGAGFDG